MTGADVVRVARSLIGVPWMHQGSTRAGCDCAGAVRLVLIELGLMPANVAEWPGAGPFLGYSRQPDSRSFTAACDTYLERADVMQPGRVVVMQFADHPQHIGVLGDYPGGLLSLIHALQSAGRVVEHRLDRGWAARVTGVYKLPGVA